MSIFSEMNTIARLAEVQPRLTDQGESIQPTRKRMFPRHRWEPFCGQCPTCNDYLFYEPPQHQHRDQPASEGGYYCETCDEWIDL